MAYNIKNGIKERKTIIETFDIVKTYGKGDLAYTALNGINIKIKEGDFIGVMGPSGSGKTTLLNVLGALDKPTSGKIRINDIEISKIKESKLFEIRRNKIGFVFQTYYLIPTLTALQNVLIPTMPLKNNKKEYVKKAKLLLSKVGLEGKEKRKPDHLSGGERQRVAIARSLILDPVIILADEPTGNLDTKTGMGIIDLMKKLNESDEKTFLIVTHDQRLAKFCQRMIKLEDGKII